MHARAHDHNRLSMHRDVYGEATAVTATMTTSGHPSLNSTGWNSKLSDDGDGHAIIILLLLLLALTLAVVAVVIVVIVSTVTAAITVAAVVAATVTVYPSIFPSRFLTFAPRGEPYDETMQDGARRMSATSNSSSAEYLLVRAIPNGRTDDRTKAEQACDTYAHIHTRHAYTILRTCAYVYSLARTHTVAGRSVAADADFKFRQIPRYSQENPRFTRATTKANTAVNY